MDFLILSDWADIEAGKVAMLKDLSRVGDDQAIYDALGRGCQSVTDYDSGLSDAKLLA